MEDTEFEVTLCNDGTLDCVVREVAMNGTDIFPQEYTPLVSWSCHRKSSPAVVLPTADSAHHGGRIPRAVTRQTGGGRATQRGRAHLSDMDSLGGHATTTASCRLLVVHELTIGPTRFRCQWQSPNQNNGMLLAMGRSRLHGRLVHRFGVLQATSTCRPPSRRFESPCRGKNAASSISGMPKSPAHAWFPRPHCTCMQSWLGRRFGLRGHRFLTTTISSGARGCLRLPFANCRIHPPRRLSRRFRPQWGVSSKAIRLQTRVHVFENLAFGFQDECPPERRSNFKRSHAAGCRDFGHVRCATSSAVCRCRRHGSIAASKRVTVSSYHKLCRWPLRRISTR